jgi:hypothetical protein
MFIEDAVMPATRKPSDTVKWTISVPREIDQRLRSHLGSQASRKGDISRFVEDAVRWKLFDLNLAEAQAHNQGVDPAVIEDEIEAALAEVRAERFGRRL